MWKNIQPALGRMDCIESIKHFSSSRYYLPYEKIPTQSQAG